MKNVIYPMFRQTDPETSKEAAKKHRNKLSERRKQVLDLVHAHPGRTSGELSRYFFNEYDVPIRVAAETPHKRLPELEAMGYVRRGDKRTCQDSGYNSVIWWPVVIQRELFE